MYTSDTTAIVSQRNTKSTIQALLKCKEKCSIPVDSSKDKGFWSNYCAASDFSDLEALSQNFRSETESPSPDHVSNNASSQESVEHQKDFNYSQKLFHIADGNLYSIFSPIQGRSYGMKPSFLRKQKYTVQECHNRGRKNLRKGLKFHNFLPSESVTSEKDNGYMNAKWKVHSECRLREEHGTKQITISNWSQSVQNPSTETVNLKNESTTTPLEANNAEQASFIKSGNSLLDNETKSSTGDPYDFNLNSQSFNLKNETMHLKQIRSKSEIVHKSSSTATKKDSLNYVLNSLIQKPSVTEKNNFSDETDNLNKSSQKHRRKPVQTRRIVPYVKYLSIMEENETLPLDLSSKCLIENSLSHSIDLYSASGKAVVDFNENNSTIECDKNIKNVLSNYLSSHDTFSIPNASSEKFMVNPVGGMMYPPITTPVTLLYPFNKSPNIEQNRVYAPPIQEASSSKAEVNANQHVFSIPSNKSYVMNQQTPTTSQFSVQKSLVKEVQSKPRRRNQRSAIKQKLEDTFRQNGFLVKTKQVSDGEATFCKFRQLRKYTRYYLKSLEQHLPDEFHKMWKGFLPPKTVLPPVLESPDPVNENLSQKVP